jgi:hypothetical protein
LPFCGSNSRLEPLIDIKKKGERIMKTKIFTLFILVAFVCLPLKAMAYERNYPAGSIIIPMDTFYQPPADGGQLEAYGLVYYLLDHQDPECLTDAPTDPLVTACQEACAGNDAACRLSCLEDVQAECEHPIAVSWVINDQKTTPDGVDLVIDVTNKTLQELKVKAVVEKYDQAGKTKNLTFNAGEDPDDTKHRITYRGALFIIDVQDLPAGVEDEVYAIIDGDSWAAVDVHLAQVPFAAPVFREMRGTPPKIALMNSTEDKTTGNAAILEGYLRLAGICGDSYEIVTPNEIAGFLAGDAGTPIHPVLGAYGPGYDFLWAPHWDATKGYDGTNGLADRDDVVTEIDNFLKRGKGMLAECASIEAFEHNTNGRFLTDKGLAHNGVDIKAATHVIYSDVTAANAQIGNFDGGFVPEGGHLHNWRPFQNGDPYNFDPDFPDVSEGNSVYNNTVKRFTTDSVGTETVDDDWDYFVGGYAHGNRDFGYVVYLGGHSYATCSDSTGLNIEPNVHPIDWEFSEEIPGSSWILNIEYQVSKDGIDYDFATGDVVFDIDNVDYTFNDWGGDYSDAGAGPLEIDFTTAGLDDKRKKLLGVTFRNTVPYDMTLKELDLEEEVDNNRKIKRMTDTNTNIGYYEDKNGVEQLALQFTDGQAGTFLIDPITQVPQAVPPGTEAELGCTDNSGCEFKNLAGVRYVLNTLFNIKYQIISHEYVRSAPIVAHPWLYQGTFEHPSYFGHFRRFDVTQTVEADDDPLADWDTAMSPRILPANVGNNSGRRVYTGKNNDPDNNGYNGDWSRIDFDAANVAALTAGLDVDPNNNSTADEIQVIERLRGRQVDYDNSPAPPAAPLYVEQNHNKLGGIMHSAPVIVRAGNSRFADPPRSPRRETAYVGDLYGMLHAIDTEYGNELWTYIPSNLLGRLQNERTDPNAEPYFAAVDGSPSVRDIYYDHDADPGTADEWRTILVCAQGFGGNSIFALDVTHPLVWISDPGEPNVLWETTDTVAPGGGMGYAYRTALDKIKVPVLDDDDNPIPGRYKLEWMIYVATSFNHIAESHGGINVFGFDLKTGTKQWTFTSTYADSVNDIPGAATTHDIDDDTFADRLYVGDMNGRMWEIALTDDPAGKWAAGESVHVAEYPDPDDESKTLTEPIPLFNAGIGHPISVSPTIITRNSHTLLIFGTGGADWASNSTRYHVYAVDATAAGLLSQTEKNLYYSRHGMALEPPSDSDLKNRFVPLKLTLEPGEKVWSSPTFSAGQIWLVTSFGSMESTDPKDDLAGSSNLRLLSLDKDPSDWPDPKAIGKVRGSIYVSNKHVYMTTFGNQILQFGEEDFSAGSGNRVVLKFWQDR